jgi:hypothetical protein
LRCVERCCPSAAQPDRRRNANVNYIGPERRKGGKADVIRQQPLLDKVLG